MFESVGVDTSKFDITNMNGIKRTVRKHGPVRGHRAGVEAEKLLDYVSARKQIYLPAYRWLLDNLLSFYVGQIWDIGGTIVLLDYETNLDVKNTSKPLSHAGLIQRYMHGTWAKTYLAGTGMQAWQIPSPLAV